MTRKVLRMICSLAEFALAASIALVVTKRDPKTNAAIMATRDTASKTSTRVKPPSRRGGCRKDIGTDLDHFIYGASRPQDLNLHFPHDGQWRGRDNSLPPDRKSTRLNSSHVPLSRMP